MGDGCVKCAKVAVYLLNIIYFLLGLGLVGIGVLLLLKKDSASLEYFQQYPDVMQIAVIVMIAVGGFILIAGITGCFGLCNENVCALVAFAVMLGVVALSFVGVCVWVFMKFQVVNKLVDMSEDALQTTMDNYGQDDASATDAWDKLHRQLKCCGTQGYADWAGKGALEPDAVPDSCCLIEAPDCGRGQLALPALIHKQGCISKLSSVTNLIPIIMGGTFAGLALIMLVGAILTAYIACSIKRGYHIV